MNYWVWNNHAFQYVTILTLESSIKIIRILIIDFNIHGIYNRLPFNVDLLPRSTVTTQKFSIYMVYMVE